MLNSTQKPLCFAEAQLLYAKALVEFIRLSVTGYLLGIAFEDGQFHVIAIPQDSLKIAAERGPYHLVTTAACFITPNMTIGEEIPAMGLALMTDPGRWEAL